MIADLLKTHEVSQHNPASLNPTFISHRLSKLSHRILIVSRLNLRQLTKRAHLSLVRKIRDDVLVRLDSSEDVRPGQRAQGRVIWLVLTLQDLGEFFKISETA